MHTHLAVVTEGSAQVRRLGKQQQQQQLNLYKFEDQGRRTPAKDGRDLALSNFRVINDQNSLNSGLKLIFFVWYYFQKIQYLHNILIPGKQGLH